MHLPIWFHFFIRNLRHVTTIVLAPLSKFFRFMFINCNNFQFEEIRDLRKFLEGNYPKVFNCSLIPTCLTIPLKEDGNQSDLAAEPLPPSPLPTDVRPAVMEQNSQLYKHSLLYCHKVERKNAKKERLEQ